MLKYFILFFFIVYPCFAYETHENVYFSFDESQEILNSIVLKHYSPTDVFYIQGYTDPIGESSYNKNLSKKRVETVIQKLVSEYGISESKVKFAFYGEEFETSLPYKERRRVEIISGTDAEITNLMANSSPEIIGVVSRDTYTSTQVSDEYSTSSLVAEDPIIEEPISLGSSDDIWRDKSQDISMDKKNSSSLYQGRYYVGFGVYNNILLSTDRGTGAEAEWVSGANYNIEAQYQFKYKKLWLGLNGSYHIQNYEVELNPIFTWDEVTPNLLKFSLVTDYELARWGFGLNVDYHKTSFIFENNSNVELIDVFMLGATLKAQYKWLVLNDWSSRVGATLDYPITGSNDIEPRGGLGYMGFIDLKRDKLLYGHGLNVKLYYGLKNYSNNQNEQTEEAAGILFSISSPHWL